MRKTMFKTILAVITAVTLSVTGAVPAVESDYITAQAATITVPVKVTYDRSGARSILDMINSMRTGSDAWYWNSDGSRYTCEGLESLSWNEGLEQAAMLRAAEIAVDYSHTRPNGEKCFTAVLDSGAVNFSVGENIAIGYSSPSEVNAGWREDNDDYSGQGHRRNMLDSSFDSVGIGHAVVNGVDCWVEEFGSNAGSNVSYGLADGDQTVDVEVDQSTIMSWNIDVESPIVKMKVGDTVSLPEAVCTFSTSGTWSYLEQVPVAFPVTATVASTDIAAQDGDKVTAVKAGSFDIVYSCEKATKTVTVNVAENEQNSAPSKVSNLKIRRSGSKVKISWKKTPGSYYSLVIRVGNKTYKKTTASAAVTVKAKKGQTVTVSARAFVYDGDGAKVYSEWTKKTVRSV